MKKLLEKKDDIETIKQTVFNIRDNKKIKEKYFTSKLPMGKVKVVFLKPYSENERDRREIFYLDQKIHRDEDEGPAIIDFSDFQAFFHAWYRNGRLHRRGGPALEFLNNPSENKWYINGRRTGEKGKPLNKKPKAQVERERLQRIDTPNFKRWFKNSKVVGSKGVPKIVFHATTVSDDFHAFRSGTEEVGMHFGNPTQAAELFRYRGGFHDKKGGRTYPVYLSIQNPLRVRDPEDGVWVSYGSIYNGLAQELMRTGKFERDEVEAALTRGVSKIEEMGELAELIKSKGYDGLVYRNRYEAPGDSWVVFEPTQVKSALHNRGTYDPQNPDIRESLARQILRLCKED